MKVQNTVTLDQAQALDKAIREAGLEWPRIEWGLYWVHTQNPINGKMEWFEASDFMYKNVVNKELLNAIPAPNLAELAKMLPPQGNDIAVRIIQVSSLLFILDSWIDTDHHALKAHLATLTPKPETK